MNRILFVFLVLPTPALAEVSDKMATQPGLWVSGGIVGIVLVWGIWKSKWVNFVGAPLAVLFFYFAWDTLRQPDIGPAIIKEQGSAYILALYGSAVLVVLGVVLGNYLNRLKCRNA